MEDPPTISSGVTSPDGQYTPQPMYLRNGGNGFGYYSTPAPQPGFIETDPTANGGDGGEFFGDDINVIMSSNSAPNTAATTSTSGLTLDSSGNMVKANGTPVQLPTVTVGNSAGTTAPAMTTTAQPGYWDRYLQHIDTYSITVPPAVGAALIGGGAVPKSWVPWAGGRGPALGSNNPLTSVPRAVFGSNAVTTNAVARTGFAGVAIAGAAVGGYNVGVLLSGLVYAAFPGSNGLPPPP